MTEPDTSREPAFVGGTITYAAVLDGVIIEPTVFEGLRSPVVEVSLKSDATRAELIVRLGPFDSEVEATATADDEAQRVWAGILVAVPHSIATMTPPQRRNVHLEPAPKPGVVHVHGMGAVASMGSVVVTVGLGPGDLSTVKRVAAATTWHHGDAVYDAYAAALREPDPVIRFIACYDAAMLAFAKNGKVEPASFRRGAVRVRRDDPDAAAEREGPRAGDAVHPCPEPSAPSQ